MPLATIGSLPLQVFSQHLSQGISLTTGQFRYRIQSRLPHVAKSLSALYGDFPFERDDGVRNFHVAVRQVRGLRQLYKPQVNFWVDGITPFKPLPLDHAFALLEWGMNWCIASQCHHYLLLHAAVVERNQQCVILPGDPGAGKSTLTAALCLSGWRLLSDEIAVLDRDDGMVVPLARPISLKNRSIDIVRQFAPAALIGEAANDTHKGTVAHLQPPLGSVQRMREKARATHIVFPRWWPGAQTSLIRRSKADAFMHVANHAFNYSILGRLGFDLAAELVEACECSDFEYSDIDDALAAFAELAR